MAFRLDSIPGKSNYRHWHRLVPASAWPPYWPLAQCPFAFFPAFIRNRFARHDHIRLVLEIHLPKQSASTQTTPPAGGRPKMVIRISTCLQSLLGGPRICGLGGAFTLPRYLVFSGRTFGSSEQHTLQITNQCSKEKYSRLPIRESI